MLGFDKTITIYNKNFDPAIRPDVTKQTYWTKTVIDGVSWSGKQKVSVGKGLDASDVYSVRIPVDAMPDGFLERDEYVKLDLDNRNGKWTAQNGDVVLLGIGPDVKGSDISDITRRFTNSFVISSVNTANMTRLLPHLRLEGT